MYEVSDKSFSNSVLSGDPNGEASNTGNMLSGTRRLMLWLWLYYVISMTSVLCSGVGMERPTSSALCPSPRHFLFTDYEALLYHK